MVLLKEPGLYCFLLRCGRDETKSLLPRDLKKLAEELGEKQRAIDEKTCRLLYFTTVLRSHRIS